MKILGYGEDALTLWALTHKLADVLGSVGDTTPLDDSVAFFRPSFGRRGGATSPQFGEFDFVVATPVALYLGETKWQKSPETTKEAVALRPEQLARHRIFATYYDLWVSREQWDWQEYVEQCALRFMDLNIGKPVPPSRSILSNNLQYILQVLSDATSSSPTVHNILLIVITDAGRFAPAWQPPEGFKLVVLDATAEVDHGFLPMGL